MDSNSKIDRLGFRLRTRPLAAARLKELAEFRSSFAQAYRSVTAVIHEELSVNPTGRPAKSTTSIIEKLKRESVRLSQMQDIAGCRIVVGDIRQQDEVVDRLMKRFERVEKVDRREHPINGYRAVHLIIVRDGKQIEVQVRTELQHLWAEWCEKLADTVHPTIKYGGGPQVVRLILNAVSEAFRDVEYQQMQADHRNLSYEEFMKARDALLQYLPEAIVKMKQHEDGRQ